MAFIDSYGPAPRTFPTQPIPMGYVYIQGLGVVPAAGAPWNAAGAYVPPVYPDTTGLGDPQVPAGPEPFSYAEGDWGIPDDGFNSSSPLPRYEEGWTMHPYAGVGVEQTMSPEYRAAHPQHYSAEAAEAWSRARMTPDELEAERIRLLEEQYGSLGFWRTLGRALWQGVSLGWGDEAIARYESWRRGTSYEEEWQRQMAINGILASIDPVAWATGEFAGSAAWNALGPSATGLAALRNAGIIGGVTSGLSLMGASPDHTDDLERFALGALIGAPLAAVTRGFTFAGQPSATQFAVDSAFATAPTLAFQAQVPGQMPMVNY
ncbi:MAG: hypothetical protein IT534_03280 [Bauldia sp.]|nr:hypothetical protein [Bauldia sp.]